ncbi:hypothetical protein L1987_31819 [Smallanthus sonchifolius]|uniref:Uncharacterized protein n=1 Tax=Smallanthus sonchifolius TaxID=185202 RepID=A0ACB9I8F3_9ASTR|nr:hypothetical protein L1987_31819 [Smallanthus sonchifolius]
MVVFFLSALKTICNLKVCLISVYLKIPSVMCHHLKLHAACKNAPEYAFEEYPSALQIASYNVHKILNNSDTFMVVELKDIMGWEVMPSTFVIQQLEPLQIIKHRVLGKMLPVEHLELGTRAPFVSLPGYCTTAVYKV